MPYSRLLPFHGTGVARSSSRNRRTVAFATPLPTKMPLRKVPPR